MAENQNNPARFNEIPHDKYKVICPSVYVKATTAPLPTAYGQKRTIVRSLPSKLIRHRKRTGRH